MHIPEFIPMMILPKTTLFPESLLPLHIFEHRYRRMLSDVMNSHRMFCVAMNYPWTSQEKPMPVAGLGLVRACVNRADGTSNLLLLGLERVRCLGAQRYKPYRLERVEVLRETGGESKSVPLLRDQLKEMIEVRIAQGPKGGVPPSLPSMVLEAAQQGEAMGDAMSEFGADLANSIQGVSELADYAASTFLNNALERQAVLESVDVATRLEKVTEFLAAEIERKN